jgi:serine/threonine protein kinase
VYKSHPNISRTLACGLDVRDNKNFAFIVSEWVNGGDLEEFVKYNQFSAFLENFSSVTGKQNK